jgi:hypothetical protein
MLIVGFWIDYHLLFVNITNVTKRFMAYSQSLYVLSPVMLFFEPKHFTDFTI